MKKKLRNMYVCFMAEFWDVCQDESLHQGMAFMGFLFALSLITIFIRNLIW